LDRSAKKICRVSTHGLLQGTALAATADDGDGDESDDKKLLL
jgi:hypothetical protein